MPSPLPGGDCLWCHWLMFWGFFFTAITVLLLFSLVNLFNVCCSVRQWFLFLFLSFSKFLYKLSPMLMQWLWFPLFANGLLFSQWQPSAFMFLYLFKHKYSLHRQNPRQGKGRHSESYRTHLGNKKHLSQSQYFCSTKNGVDWYIRCYVLCCLTNLDWNTRK